MFIGENVEDSGRVSRVDIVLAPRLEKCWPFVPASVADWRHTLRMT
jgi:hypothetical protein